jgi:hypothetical protein
MRPRPAAVVKDIGVVAPGLLEGVGQMRQAIEGLLVVDRMGELDHSAMVRSQPDRIEGDGAEWKRAEDTAE